MKTTFYMVRHGQPDWQWAEERRFYGPASTYIPLTAEGVEQIEAAVRAVHAEEMIARMVRAELFKDDTNAND